MTGTRLKDLVKDVYDAEDITAVNRYLEQNYTTPADAVWALAELEKTGLWEIQWHHSSDGDGRDGGAVLEYLG